MIIMESLDTDHLFFTSDTHFHHANIIQFCDRPFRDVEEMDEIGFDDYVYGDGLTMIEWANLIEDILPGEYTEVLIEKELSNGTDYRRITIEEKC